MRQNFSWGDITLDSDPTTNQLMDASKAQHGEPVSATGLLTRVWVRSHLQQQEGHKDSCVSKAHSSMGDSSQILGTWGTLQSLQAAAQQVQECPFQGTLI